MTDTLRKGENSMVQILIVEDDSRIAAMIFEILQIGGYRGVICGNGREAVPLILQGGYDLILLDVMLPGLDGFHVLEEIKNKGVPVIFLTARLDVADKVKGLRMGAEDYIVKPFEAVELLARIEVVLRRFQRLDSTLRFEDIVLDTERHTAQKQGVPLSLTPKEFELLAFFIQNESIALTRERLLSAVWGYEFEGQTRTVDTHVQQLRKKCGLQNRLVTIPKLGYRLEQGGGL